VISSPGALAAFDTTLPDEAPAARGAQRCPTCGQDFPPSYVVCPKDATPLGVAGAGVERDPLIGTVLAGTYRLSRVLGRGGMGRLYVAEHTRLDRRFAVKVIHESHAGTIESVRRFEREADALARIRSDHVVDVVDVLRTPDGRTAIVTDLLEGEDLQRRLERGPMSVAEAIGIARQACRGLAAAHAASVVHRDLKPSNLFLARAEGGRVALKILDFGVAKLAGEDDMTRTGVVLGTPAYMAPEQARGSSDADPRSDVYAIGAVLYRMTTGHMPYEGGDAGATLARLLVEPPPRPRALSPQLPLALEVVIQRAMARQPGERPPSALALDAALAEIDPAVGAGSRSEAPHVERDARSARPMAALVVTGGAAAAGAAAAAAIAALSAMVAGNEAQEALGRALTLVGGVSIAIGALALLSRALAPRWSSAPAVQHGSARIAAALVASLASLGAGALAALGTAAFLGAPVEIGATTAFGLLVAAAACAMPAARDERPG
jgi:serine/threonine-protein kinase